MHNNNHTDIIELIPAYALGALDADEAAEAERHLAHCADCQAELAAYETVVAELPLAAAQIDPPPALKGRLMAQVRASEKPILVVSAPPPWWQPITDSIRAFWAGPRWRPVLALVALIVLIGAYFIWQQSSIEQVELTATDAAPDAQGLIEIAANGRDANLSVTGLPPLPAEQQYQLWLIRDGQRDSGAVFSVNADGSATVPVESERPLSEYGAFGITIEPAGGSPGPTGERVLGHNL